MVWVVCVCRRCCLGWRGGLRGCALRVCLVDMWCLTECVCVVFCDVLLFDLFD